MGFIDDSEDPLTTPSGVAPPPVILPKVTGVIEKAVASLRDGKSAFILVHERTQDGSINQTNGVFVRRFGDNVSATMWVGHEWNKPGTVAFGASLMWEF